MDFLKTLVARVQEDDVLGVSAELAYRWLFALVPFLIFLGALSSYVAGWLNIENPTQDILNEVGSNLPDDAASILAGQLEGIFDTQQPGLLSVTAVLALWGASSGTKTVMKALNRAYDVEEGRSFVRKQVVGVVLTLLGGLAFLVAAIVLVVGQVVGRDVAATLGLGEAWAVAVTWARVPLVLLLMAVAVAFVYWSAPATRVPWRWFSWGAGIFVIAWLLATLAFGFYVSNFASYSNTYGSLGGVIVLMTWLYLTALLLVMGAEVNVTLERHVLGSEVPEGMAQRNAAQRDAAQRDAAQREAGRSPGAERDSGRRAPQRGPEEVQVERRPPREAGRTSIGSLSTALGALVAGVVLVRLWR